MNIRPSYASLQLLAVLIISHILPHAALAQGPAWPSITLAQPRDVNLRGPVGDALQRGIARLSQPPYTKDWLLADVSFKVNRIFTNYSGDVSGRFLELATLTSPAGKKSPDTLPGVLAEIAGYQKPDGHFGLEMDFTKPVKKNSPPIPMLWGNARLLVGLVTAAREYNDPQLLAAARKLGDFYVDSAAQFCSPSREREFLATGTYGDGFACCYFPAIESLAMLYRATQDARYLEQARRMAELFRKFDALPTEHSHGNLCAWRGILELYAITGDRSYLDRTRAKWDAAVNGNYVWPIGGVGEHWYPFFGGDEGCSESDWLRLNLYLWRFTGETRYLDMAERLLHNQYAANQCPNGGYGMCHLDGDAAGPVAKHSQVEEWNFCCSFHGPLGLHFLKAYLAAGSDKAVFISFPLEFTSRVQASGREWQVSVRQAAGNVPEHQRVQIELAPIQAKAARTTVYLRMPNWAGDVQVADASGAKVPFRRDAGCLCIERDFAAGQTLTADFRCTPFIEARRFKPVKLNPGQISRVEDASIVLGSDILFASSSAAGRLTLLATVDPSGQLGFPARQDRGFITVALPNPAPTNFSATAALESARPIVLRPWSDLPQRKRAAFAHHLLVVPSTSLSSESLSRFAQRSRDINAAGARAAFGEHLETQPELWDARSEWKFSPGGLQVTGGDIGLLDGEGYRDYTFEFDLILPVEGQGLAGWLVRTPDLGNGLMFQVQSADSSFNAPQYKTKPNTLRPHIRRNGQWTIADPVPLPKEIRRGETHHWSIQCRGDRIEVSLDGARVHTQDDAGFHAGSVGFRASGTPEQGLFRNVSLRQLTSPN